MRVTIQPSALGDLRDGFHFYEQQQAGLGGYFLDSVYSDIDSLQLYAGIHSVHFKRYHRLLSKRFPFAIYYWIEGEIAYVRAVLDLRRGPEWIKKKLQ